MAIIMSNTDKLEIFIFAKLIWEEHRHLEFVAMTRLIH